MIDFRGDFFECEPAKNLTVVYYDVLDSTTRWW